MQSKLLTIHYDLNYQNIQNLMHNFQKNSDSAPGDFVYKLNGFDEKLIVEKVKDLIK
ncbi:hypothetical protein [Mycoplasmopsis cynos]|uniref:hypothetical protein n=1 Tax=Mycoplasmopsis cynos TaxID=171284 RepID=UPI002208C6D5|nr:hypothetical protein [Mycoplasmopsis cynos]UWV83112.1 hypothetical protein NW067_02445 [Mycoplasmopsis cynos]